MAGKLSINQVQLGDSVTATQNAVLQTNVDGTFKLARGNAGATTQDIITVDANGRVAMPQSVVAFSAYQNTTQSVPNITWTKLQLQAEEFDTASFFDSVTNYRFQPTVAGYYQFEAGFSIAVTSGFVLTALYKNGVIAKSGPNTIATTNGLQGSVVSLLYLNGSTDYVENWVFHSTGGAQNSNTTAANTYFQGILIAKA